jgi:DNA-binding NarL/FixJ family response regulator
MMAAGPAPGLLAAAVRTLRVVLAEDSLLAREGIVRVLEGLDGIELVAVCGDLDSLRAEIDRSAPDVVVTDIRMPPSHTDEGVRIAEELRSTQPRTGVVVLSQHADPVYATEVFARGASRRAYLLKERLKDAGELERAIREVAEGGAVVDPRVVEELLSARPESSPLQSLTAREREVLELMAAGHANSAIAERLSITKRGVEHHVNALFAKLGLRDDADVSRRVKAALLYHSRRD